MSSINIAPDMWQPADRNERENELKNISCGSFWAEALARFKKNKAALASFMFIVFLVCMALIGPVFCRYSFDYQDLEHINMFPDSQHWFGTDYLGRDLFVRVLMGARISLLVAFAAMISNFFIGVLYGGIAGYAGGHIDNLMMRIVDIIDTIPLLLYAVLIMTAMGNDRGIINMIVALASVYWVNMARIVRGQIIVLREQEFIAAAIALGAGSFRILTKHLIPNAIGVIIAAMTMFIPTAIFTEAFLSFIGLGVSPPATSWGALVSEAVGGFRSFPHQLFFPSAAICITMLAFNTFGEALRDSFDPGLRR